jgi:diaminohydroxyphosphoribosylaminopyrimidine deaminase/5-amino-6-(5-phosphoribosylamino)uracil reductase
VIVDPAGEIAGEGFYLYERVQHAETIALAQAGERARGGTAYVSLEPHAHQGRTAPCTDALIKAGIRRVVAPVDDPNPKVSGRGFAHLRAAGVEVCTGLMAEEAARLNEAYIHFMRTGWLFRSTAKLRPARAIHIGSLVRKRARARTSYDTGTMQSWLAAARSALTILC